MKKLKASDFFLYARWPDWYRWAAWAICIGMIYLLGEFRRATDAEFALASLALFPVLFIAWIGGKKSGLLMALFAVAVWAAGDFIPDRQFSSPWIPWVNAVTHFMTYGLMAILAAHVRLQFEREHERAIRDVLTGLLNRRALLDAGASEAERSKRYGHPLAVVFLDLDNFKKLNDTRGHEAGDAALVAVSRALLDVLRASDRVARLGGDEFAILLPETKYDEAIEAGHKLSAAVNDALRDFSPATGSIGIAWFGKVDRPFSAMLKAADDLMYEVKVSGKCDIRAKSFTAADKLTREV